MHQEAERHASGRAGIPPAGPGLQPVPSDVVERSFANERSSTFGVPGRIPGTAGWKPALPNAGTFAVQDSQVKAEDAASANADNLFQIGVIRRDTPVANANVSADGDYTQLLVDNLGKLWTANSQAEDVASADGDRGSATLAVRKATPANTSGTDGDYEFLQMSAGRLWTNTLLGDGTNAITVRGASTGAAPATDVALVVTIRDVNTNDQKNMAGSAPVVVASNQAWQTGMSPRAFSAAFSTLTRPANTTAYAAGDHISNNAR